MEYFAHSPKGEYPAQSYESHIKNVFHRSLQYAMEAGAYSAKARDVLCAAVHNSALLHDLGKLDEVNQAVLSGSIKAAHLPLNHVDAGTTALLAQNDLYAALNVYAHHRGLPDMAAEFCRETLIFRDNHVDVRKKVDTNLSHLHSLHTSLIQDHEKHPAEYYDGNQGVLFRMMLSCLADADHTDTTIHYGQTPATQGMPKLKAADRLKLLDKYVSTLGGSDERSNLRREMYASCRNSKVKNGFSICDSPVGSGKTTAIIAHLLQQAIQRNSRRIFVVLPYTSIITQSVEVYRKSLVLPGEDPEKVIAELHCRADFEDKDARYLTALWRAPIIVTTAVAFFETLASNKPSSLRRLHELPGSLVFIDESHNALPLKLLPLAWHWMNVLAEEWSCYWILASGSLVRFWQLPNFTALGIPQPNVGEIVDSSLRDALMQYEKERIRFCYKEQPISRKELAEFVQSLPGPRLLIMNTVQNAAVVANDICKKTGRHSVEHLSTALSAEDRERTIARVKERLLCADDNNWTLVATSCVEAGVDFSFRTGLRECSSLLSLLQATGRVNRHGSYRGTEMWSFTMQDDSMLVRNPGLETSIEVLQAFFEKNVRITPELCTESINQEFARNDNISSDISSLLKDEDALQFKSISENFVVIDSNTVTAVVDDGLYRTLKSGGGNWQQLQKLSVSIRYEKIRKWGLEEIVSGIYHWTLQYDSFIGYMRGVLELEAAKKETLIM